MASTVEGGARTGSRSGSGGYESTAGYGWVLFAGTMIGIVGTLNFIYGIAAVSNSKFYTPHATYVISNLKTWGWVMIIIGAIQLCASIGIWIQAGWARWVGILTAGVNSVIQLLVVPGQPFLALALFSIDILVLYGLVAHGRRPRTA